VIDGPGAPSVGTRATPVLHLAMLLAFLAAFAAGLPRLQQDPSLEALMRADHPALALREQVRATFGLEDPIVVALATDRPDGMFDAAALDALVRVTQALAALPAVDPEQVFGLTTQQWVHGDGDALLVQPLLPEGPIGPVEIATLRRALAASPAYRGTLIAHDGSAALVAAELRDERTAADTYEQILARIGAIPLPPGMRAHVAGEAVAAGFLSRFIERDSMVLTPAAALLMLVLLRLFLRSWQGMVAGAFVMLGTLAATVGAMAWVGAKFYVVTTCMPAILLCISIADIIHYGERVARLHAEGLPAHAALAQGLQELGRPILLTSFTNAAGFAGMALTTDELPLVGYGAAAAFGVMVAWLLTVVGVPAIFRLIGLPRVPPGPPVARLRFARLGALIARRPAAVLCGVAAVLAIGIWQTTRVQFNENRILNFGRDSSVYQADRLLSERFAGPNYLDLYLRVAPGETLLAPERVAAIADLQAWMEREGGFSATTSFVDVLQGVVRAARPGDPALPADADEAEQFLFLFEVSGRPGDLRQEITADRREAYLRGHLPSGEFRRNREIMAALEPQLRARLSSVGIEAQMTGAVALTDTFVGPYLPSTMWSIATSALLVGLMCALLMRSATQGMLCMVPVAVGVVCVFGLMGALGIWLSIATSMFASIGIGLGVDFAIHTLHAARRGRAAGHSGEALTQFVLADIGRPLTANAMILSIGFAVTTLSSIPPLRSFGVLVAATVLASWLSAILILPALIALAERRAGARLHAAVGRALP
jgi:uncharacterized protein